MEVAGGIDGIAETNDHQMLGWQHDDSLAEIAECEKRVTRNPAPDTPFCMFVLAAIGPEAGAIVGAERWAGGKIPPFIRQDAIPADHAVVQIKQSESRPIPGACQHV